MYVLNSNVPKDMKLYCQLEFAYYVVVLNEFYVKKIFIFPRFKFKCNGTFIISFPLLFIGARKSATLFVL